MKFDNDCCTLEQGLELDRLGVKQEAFCYSYRELCFSGKDKIWQVSNPIGTPNFFDNKVVVARFNTGELIAMFPDDDVHVNRAEWFASMLIKYIKEEMITVAEVNKRLDEFHEVKKDGRT